MGRYSLPTIQRVLSKTNFVTDREKYSYIKIDRKYYSKLLALISKYDGEYSEVICDSKELTLLILQKTWRREVSKQIPFVACEGPMAIITCEVKEPTVTGYLLEILKKVSPANISVFVQGAFTTDHIFVHYKDLDKTLKILSDLKTCCVARQVTL